MDGGASPPYGTVGTTITFTATGFTPGEDVSFWFTLPNGNVVGTAAPVPGGVNADGTIGPLPFPIDQTFVNLATGRWAITFEGASSHHQSIIYFCVYTVADATAIAEPTTAPTNTSVPATATTAATEAPTDTPALPTTAPTEAATATTEVLPTSTTEATAVPIVSTPVPPEPTATTEVLPLPTSIVPGMPTTGNPDGTLPTTLTLLALAVSILSVGWLVRRKTSTNR